MFVAKTVRRKTFAFYFLPSHDAERHLTAVSLGNKFRCFEGKPTVFLRVYRCCRHWVIEAFPKEYPEYQLNSMEDYEGKQRNKKRTRVIPRR